MAGPLYFDRVHETTSTTGTGSLTLTGAVDASYRTFASVCSTNDTFYYILVEIGVGWEAGLGTYSGTNTLARTSVKASSNAGSAISLGSGAKRVFMTPIAFMFPASLTGFGVPRVATLTDGATPALDASLGDVFLLTAAGNRTIAVPSNPTSGQKITIVHKASGADRTLALNTGANGFRFGTDITGLTATTSGKTDYIGAQWNAADSKWDVIAYAKGF